ncbi:hypothetical protein C7B67_27280 [filamentous cyanobacterium Phorm 6]|nr:hypothetical protein C7B67_27280 [filamentous cyanobacterium Phorm 6]
MLYNYPILWWLRLFVLLSLSGNYAKIKKPGFSENLGWWGDIGRNPVSGNYAKIKKPGFSENLGWWREYLGRNPVSGNYAKINAVSIPDRDLG